MMPQQDTSKSSIKLILMIIVLIIVILSTIFRSMPFSLLPRVAHTHICGQYANVTSPSADYIHLCEGQKLATQRIAEDIPVTFIHVGKAGGGSVDTVLQQMFTDYFQVHIKHVAKEHLIHRKIIVVIRDPLERFESAYKWVKHQQERHAQMPVSRWGLFVQKMNEIFDCYPSLSELGKHCLEHTQCASLLRHEMNPDESLSHLGKGLYYYLMNVDWRAFKDDLFVLSQEHLNDDFNFAISYILGKPVSIELPRVHADYPEKNDSLPVEYHANVKSLLERNYKLYNALLLVRKRMLETKPVFS